MKLEDIYFLEAIKYFPKERKYLDVCGTNCRKYLLLQLNEIKPKIVLALGDKATKTILNIKYKNFNKVVDKQFIVDDFIVIPIYHPSPISPKSYTGNIDIFKKLRDII